MRYWKLLFCAALVFGFSIAAYAAVPDRTLTPTEAAQAVGQHATVCGVVANVHFASGSRGQPTFIDLGAAYPDEPFQIVIWGEDRSNFSPSPETWQGKQICVTGIVKLYKGIPEIIARNADQISALPR